MNFKFDKLNPFNKGKEEVERTEKTFGDGVAEKIEKTMTPEEQKRMELLNQTTEEKAESIKEAVKPENFIKLTPEKRKLVVDKVKVLLTLTLAAGVTVTVANFGALDKITEMTGAANTQAVMEGAGVLVSVVSAIGLGIRNIWKSLQAEKI